MRIELIYPVLFRTDRMPDDDTYVESQIAQAVDIRELAEDELPVAVRFKRQHDRQVDIYRYHDATDQLYRPFTRLSSIKPAPEAIRDRVQFVQDYPTFDLFHASHVQSLTLQAAGATTRQDFQLRTLNSSGGLGDGANRQDVDEARAAFENFAGGLFICAKRLCRPVEEPVFALYRTNVGWKTELRRGAHARLGGSRLTFHFSLDRFEDMVRFQTMLSGVTGSPATRDELEMDGYRSTVDAYAVDVEFCARDFVARIEDAVDPEARVRSRLVDRIGLAEFPDEVVETYLMARRFLGLAREDRDECRIDDMMQAVATASEYQKVPKLRHYLPKPSEIAFHLEKWNMRPISFRAELGGPTP